MIKHLVILNFLFLASFSGASQDSIQAIPEKVVIGLTETPPFVMQKNSRFEGLSISSWGLVNRKLNLDYEFRTYPDLNSLLLAVEKGEVDFSINPITVTDLRMERMNFSQPYFISYTAIAKKKTSKTWTYLKNLLSWNFISALLILLGIIFIFGFLVWIFERRANKEEFGEGPKGIFQGFWWSAVTMTTVGYGDKSPRTFGGRLVGLIWMFLAIIMISSLTAGIASSLTVQNIQNDIRSIEDLDRFDVITVKSSSALELLNQYNVSTEEVLDANEGIEKLMEEKTPLFVYDQPILSYIIDEKDLQDELELLPETLKKDYYSYTFPKNSKLIDIINPVLVGTLKSLEWNNLIKEYN